MVAVLACSQTRGGRLARAIASPRMRVELIRDSLISLRLAGPYLQLTLRPARLMTTSDPSSASAQLPSVAASQAMIGHGALPAERLKTVTSWPSRWKARARRVPTCPEPPGITIFIAGPTKDQRLAR